MLKISPKDSVRYFWIQPNRTEASVFCKFGSVRSYTDWFILNTYRIEYYPRFIYICPFFPVDHEHANGLAQPLPCDQCGKLFYNPFKLKTHVKRNHVKTQCSLCGDMVVANKMSYHIQQVHTRSEDRPHKCPTCGNYFFSK